MICDGCLIKSSEMVNSIIGVRTRLEEKTSIENTLVMGADYYQSESERTADLDAGVVPIGIGAGSVMRNVILDKNARIGRNVKIINKDKIENVERESEGYWIRNGIVIVIKDTTIPDNAVI